MTGDWRKLQHEELHKFYSSSNIIRLIKTRSMEWTEHVEGMRRGKRNAYRILVGEPERKRPLQKL
jgi:hypothetical protein